jgi:hypothetical protein
MEARRVLEILKTAKSLDLHDRAYLREQLERELPEIEKLAILCKSDDEYRVMWEDHAAEVKKAISDLTV